MNIKAQYLLEASLETLHFETKEWIEEVRFWFDELSILGELVDHKLAHNNLEDQIHKDLQLNLNSMLDCLSMGTLSSLMDHERYLSGLFELDDLSEEHKYRVAHKKFVQEMIHLKNDIRALKKRVLDFLERKEFGLRHDFLS